MMSSSSTSPSMMVVVRLLNHFKFKAWWVSFGDFIEGFTARVSTLVLIPITPVVTILVRFITLVGKPAEVAAQVGPFKRAAFRIPSIEISEAPQVPAEERESPAAPSSRKSSISSVSTVWITITIVSETVSISSIGPDRKSVV